MLFFSSQPFRAGSLQLGPFPSIQVRCLNARLGNHIYPVNICEYESVVALEPWKVKKKTDSCKFSKIPSRPWQYLSLQCLDVCTCLESRRKLVNDIQKIQSIYHLPHLEKNKTLNVTFPVSEFQPF